MTLQEYIKNKKLNSNYFKSSSGSSSSSSSLTPAATTSTSGTSSTTTSTTSGSGIGSFFKNLWNKATSKTKFTSTKYYGDEAAYNDGHTQFGVGKYISQMKTLKRFHLGNEFGSASKNDVFIDGFEDPTHLTFKIEFGEFGASIMDNTTIASIQKKSLTSNVYFMDYDLMPMGLLDLNFSDINGYGANATSNNVFDNQENYNAVNYLINRNEDRRAQYLRDFIEGLYTLQRDFPYMFSKVSGLQKLVEADATRGQRLKDCTIQLTCLSEGVDRKISTLMELYRKAAWDEIYQRWILPDIMRYFKMVIYVFDDRSLQMGNGEFSPDQDYFPIMAFECAPAEFSIKTIVDNEYSQNYSEAKELSPALEVKVKNVKTYMTNGLFQRVKYIKDIVTRSDHYAYDDATESDSFGQALDWRFRWMQRMFMMPDEYNAFYNYGYGTELTHYLGDEDDTARFPIRDATIEQPTDTWHRATVTDHSYVIHNLKDLWKSLKNIITKNTVLIRDSRTEDRYYFANDLTRLDYNTYVYYSDQHLIGIDTEGVRRDVEAKIEQLTKVLRNMRYVMNLDKPTEVVDASLVMNLEKPDEKLTELIIDDTHDTQIVDTSLVGSESPQYPMTPLNLNLTKPDEEMTELIMNLGKWQGELTPLDLNLTKPDQKLTNLVLNLDLPDQNMTKLILNLDKATQDLTALELNLTKPSQDMAPLVLNLEKAIETMVHIYLNLEKPKENMIAIIPNLEKKQQELAQLILNLDKAKENMTKLNLNLEKPDESMTALILNVEKATMSLTKLILNISKPVAEFVKMIINTDKPDENMTPLILNLEKQTQNLTEIIQNLEKPTEEMTSLNLNLEKPDENMTPLIKNVSHPKEDMTALVIDDTKQTEEMTSIDINDDKSNMNMSEIEQNLDHDKMNMAEIELNLKKKDNQNMVGLTQNLQKTVNKDLVGLIVNNEKPAKQNMAAISQDDSADTNMNMTELIENSSTKAKQNLVAIKENLTGHQQNMIGEDNSWSKAEQNLIKQETDVTNSSMNLISIESNNSKIDDKNLVGLTQNLQKPEQGKMVSLSDNSDTTKMNMTSLIMTEEKSDMNMQSLDVDVKNSSMNLTGLDNTNIHSKMNMTDSVIDISKQNEEMTPQSFDESHSSMNMTTINSSTRKNRMQNMSPIISNTEKSDYTRSGLTSINQGNVYSVKMKNVKLVGNTEKADMQMPELTGDSTKVNMKMDKLTGDETKSEMRMEELAKNLESNTDMEMSSLTGDEEKHLYDNASMTKLVDNGKENMKISKFTLTGEEEHNTMTMTPIEKEDEKALRKENREMTQEMLKTSRIEGNDTKVKASLSEMLMSRIDTLSSLDLDSLKDASMEQLTKLVDILESTVNEAHKEIKMTEIKEVNSKTGTVMEMPKIAQPARNQFLGKKMAKVDEEALERAESGASRLKERNDWRKNHKE